MRRAICISSSTRPSEVSRITASAASDVMSLCAPKATPTVAACIAGASSMPSPRNSVGLAASSRTIATLSSGLFWRVARDLTPRAGTALPGDATSLSPDFCLRSGLCTHCLSHFGDEKRLTSRSGRLALLQDVIEGFGATRRKAREPDVTGRSSTREHFDDLFLAHYAHLVAILRRILGDHARAEDLANEVFLKLYRRPLLQESDGNVPGWLYRTATNLGIDALRSLARRNRYEKAAAQAQR